MTVVFLDRLSTLPTLPHTHVAHLDSLYRLSSTSNGELRLRFYELALHGPSPGPEAYALGAIKWVCGDDGTGIVKGRMKFCRPLFKAVSKVDPTLAREMFDKFGDSFHPIAKKFIKNVRAMFDCSSFDTDSQVAIGYWCLILPISCNWHRYLIANDMPCQRKIF